MDALEITRMFFALIAVLGLIGLLAAAARKAGWAAGGGAFGRPRRLAIVETLALDARRRATILRCDGREHFIILGPAGETVVASDLPGVSGDALTAGAAGAGPTIAGFAPFRTGKTQGRAAEAA